MAERLRRLPLWASVALPMVVLAVALVIGSGVLHATPETPAQRAAAIDSVLRCPSCTDVSVAQSNESTAIAVRNEVRQLVAEGRSTSQIKQALVAQYGPSILLVPPDAAGFPLIWIIPVVLGVATLSGVGALFWRRTRQFDELRREQAAEEATT